VKISTKGQYALEALVDLHLHAADGQESLKNVAQRRGISEHYLEQIFATLRKGGIVASTRGAQGGYRLSREPGSITAGAVIRALEGPLFPVKCVLSTAGDENHCPMVDCCATRSLWVTVSKEIDSVLDGVTLGDLLSTYSKRTDESKD
jgi:Rrf2 family transcriptional regulator, cysteine metabolism repressor